MQHGKDYSEMLVLRRIINDGDRTLWNQHVYHSNDDANVISSHQFNE